MKRPVPGIDYNRPGVHIWAACTVRRILSNRSYIGEFNYGGIRIDRPDLAIVKPEDLKLAQEILLGNIEWARIKGRDPVPGRYLLLDHIFCVCGSRMTSSSQRPQGGKKYHYYRCITRSYPSLKNNCRAIQVRSINADTIVWTWLEMLLGMDEEKLRRGLNKLAAEREDGTQSKRASIISANAQIDNIGKKITNLMRAFENDDDKDVVAGLRLRINELKKAKADLITYRDKIAGELSNSSISSSQIGDIITFSRRIRGKMAHATYEQKKELLRMLHVHVELERDEDRYRLDMSCGLPGGTHSEKLPLRKSYSSNE